MKLLRTIRLDASDTFVYTRAAAAGEWAVPGAFEFWTAEPTGLKGREKQAFRGGFLGLTSFGWSTLVVAQPITAEERLAAVASLARHLMAAHGAPDLAAAMTAAEEEITAAMGLAEHPEGTLIALHRTLDGDGNIREQFRTLHAADAREAAQMPCSAGAFAIVDDDGAVEAGQSTGVAGDVDLFDLASRSAAASAKAQPQ
ncbi:MAG: DUF6505 family protein [Hyphomicrobiaceae bacterium]